VPQREPQRWPFSRRRGYPSEGTHLIEAAVECIEAPVDGVGVPVDLLEPPAQKSPHGAEQLPCSPR
jgi:hypothetical protein